MPTKTKVTQIERDMAKRCFCKACGGPMVPVKSGAVCEKASFRGGCPSGRIDPNVTKAHFKALEKVRKSDAEAIDAPR